MNREDAKETFSVERRLAGESGKVGRVEKEEKLRGSKVKRLGSLDALDLIPHVSVFLFPLSKISKLPA
jgi:hypothetical protein